MPYFVPALLYAEIHHRFHFFPFSRYYQEEPEIIADVPYRIEPGHQLSILMLVKDAHLFPIRIDSVEITIDDEYGKRRTISVRKDLLIEQRWWYETTQISTANLNGKCKIQVKFLYTVYGQTRTCINHNLLTSNEKPLETFISNYPLPGKEKGWYWGDLHCHTALTEDFVEFGAPLDVTRDAARTCGLDFLAVTDHSYDLDDKPGSWTETDPKLQKWYSSREEIAELNRNGLPILIPGEEVSSTNSKGKNVHTLMLNHPNFFPGSGDGAEQWRQKESEHTIIDLIEAGIDGSLTIASHPRMPFSFLSRLLLNRGQWEAEDFKLEGVTGFQILNGRFDKGFESGLEYWTDTLLEGQKKFIYAGNDAHGNFNRFRQIKLPMISLWDHRDQILGKCRTGIKISGEVNEQTLIQALRSGKCIISDGPLLDFNVTNSLSSVTLGESINGSNIVLKIKCISTYEFGKLAELVVILGDLDSRIEEPILKHKFKRETFEDIRTLELNISGTRGYLRAELKSEVEDGSEHLCYTNPIWINT